MILRTEQRSAQTQVLPPFVIRHMIQCIADAFYLYCSFNYPVSPAFEVWSISSYLMPGEACTCAKGALSPSQSLFSCQVYNTEQHVQWRLSILCTGALFKILLLIIKIITHVLLIIFYWNHAEYIFENPCLTLTFYKYHLCAPLTYKSEKIYINIAFHIIQYCTKEGVVMKSHDHKKRSELFVRTDHSNCSWDWSKKAYFK